jgi:hypothetical protein
MNKAIARRLLICLSPSFENRNHISYYQVRKTCFQERVGRTCYRYLLLQVRNIFAITVRYNNPKYSPYTKITIFGATGADFLDCIEASKFVSIFEKVRIRLRLGVQSSVTI